MDPGDIRPLEPRLSKHAERPIEANIGGTRQLAAIGDQLIPGAAADIQGGWRGAAVCRSQL
jgi:hypothetical protein